MTELNVEEKWKLYIMQILQDNSSDCEERLQTAWKQLLITVNEETEIFQREKYPSLQAQPLRMQF